MHDLIERFNLNREKIVFILTLLIVGGWSVGKITGAGGGVAAFQQGSIKSEPPRPVPEGLTEAGTLIAEPEFKPYWNDARPDPFEIVSDWKPVPSARLDYPALPTLLPVMLPPRPGPGLARLDLLARTFTKHELPEDAPPPEGGGDDPPAGGDAIADEQANSRFASKVRKDDVVDNGEGGRVRGKIIEESRTQLTIARNHDMGQRVTVALSKGRIIERRISLAQVYDAELTRLAGSDITDALAWIKDCIKYGFRVEAVKHLDLLVKKHSTDPRPYLLAADYFGKAFAYDQLAGLLRLAKANGVNDASLQRAQAQFLARPFNGFYDQAVPLYKAAVGELTRAEDKLEARFELAAALRAKGDLKEAVELYRALTREAGDQADRARAGMCTCLLEQGEVQGVLRLLDGELTDARLLSLRGSARLLDDKLADAIADLKAARTADPESGDIALSLGLALLYAGNPKPARVEFDAARQLMLDDPSWAYLAVGLADHLEKKTAQALEQGYAQALRTNASNPMAHYLKGVAALESGDRTTAKTAFAESVRVAFTFAPGHLWLGAMSLEDGEHQAAQMHLEQAALLHPDPVTFAYLGRAFLASGDLSRAERAFNAGLSRSSTMAPCREGLAYILNARGNQREAVRAFRLIRESEYAKAAVLRITENQNQRFWADRFTREDTSGRVLRKWVEQEEAGVQITLDRHAVKMEGRQSRADRITELDRELPKGRGFVLMAADVDTGTADKAYAGLHVKLPTKRSGGGAGGLYFGVAPGKQLFIAMYDKDQPTQINEEEFRTFKYLGDASQYLENGKLRLELERVKGPRGRDTGYFRFRAGGKDLTEAPLQINVLMRARNVRVGLFAVAPSDIAIGARFDDIRVVTTGR